MHSAMPVLKDAPKSFGANYFADHSIKVPQKFFVKFVICVSLSIRSSYSAGRVKQVNPDVFQLFAA